MGIEILGPGQIHSAPSSEKIEVPLYREEDGASKFLGMSALQFFGQSEARMLFKTKELCKNSAKLG
jgi:hypothetical protein